MAKELWRVALVKGAQATTAIEGNTLSEDQVAGIMDGTFEAPPSRAYQQREVQNVIDVLQSIDSQLIEGDDPPVITKALICEYNRRILAGTEYEDHVEPGQVRTVSVTVGKYRGAPAEDCDFLLDKLANWLESDVFRSPDQETRFALAVMCAVYAHLYLAWIHPFGDGNGRTARMLEFLILARCGLVPLPAAHLLSNHYNLTRDQYARELARASRETTSLNMLAYAIQGFVDGLREQIALVRAEQLDVTWINHVHETMGQFPSTATRDRQRSLVLAMAETTLYTRRELEELTPKLASLYAVAGDRMIGRDLNKLKSVGLVQNVGRRWMSNSRIVEAFLPPMAELPSAES